MFIYTATGAVALTIPGEPTAASLQSKTLSAEPPTNSPDSLLHLPAPAPEQLRHLLLGTSGTVQTTILHLHQLGYAAPNDWSRLLSTGRAHEVMAILTKRIESRIRRTK